MPANARSAAGHRLRRESFPDAIAQSLQTRILNGEFKDGDQLVQETLAQEYGCSRMPVREALRQLEAAGLVAMEVHKGAVVSSLTPDQILELFELRALLECNVLPQALERMTDQSLAEARAVLPELEAAYRDRDVSRYGSLNWEFHKSLYAAAGKSQTVAVLQSINLQTDRYIRLHLLLTDAFSNAETEHRELLDLCEKRQIEAAQELLHNHILNTGRNLVAALEKHRASESSRR